MWRFTLVAALSLPAFAQSFESAAKSPFLANLLLVQAVAADFDGDTDLDVVGQVWSSHLAFYRNRGEGWFVQEGPTHPTTPDASSWVTDLAAADLDGDGDVDVLIGRQRTSPCGLPDLWLRNNGTGSFALLNVNLVNDNTWRVLPFDFDNDGDQDILQVNAHTSFFCSAWSTRVLRNNGSGGFTDVTASVMPGAPFLRVGAAILDVQPDGWLDVVFDDGSVFLNNGSQLLLSAIVVPALTNLRAADLDGDLDADLFGIDAGGLRVVRNDGGGLFTLFGGPPLPPGATTVAAGDIDGDADLDLLLVGAWILQPAAARLWRQDPGMLFVDVTAAQLPPISGGSPVALFCDSDADGDQDLLLTTHGILHNVGNGLFVRSDVPPGPESGRAMEVDGDGNVDLVSMLTYGSNGSIGYWRNAGDGQFSFVGVIVTGNIAYEPGFVLFDMEGDGDVDMFISRNSEIMARNDGGGIFTDRTAVALPPPVIPPGYRSVSKAVANDFDGDGDVDLFLARGTQVPASPQDSLYLNSGAGVFVDMGPTHFVDAAVTIDAVALDFDRDGDRDLAVESEGGSVRLFANDGTAHFTDVTAATLPNVSADELLATDVDGDLYPDLVLGRGAFPAILLRNNNGVFVTTTGQLAAHTYSINPVAVDFDVDGDPDLLLDGRWQRNDGTGTFTAITLPAIGSAGLADENVFADVDGDGDPDLVGRLRNHHRQLENVLPPRLGLHGELWLHARSDTPGWSSLGLLFFGTLAAAPMPLGSLGVLRLDPATAVLHSLSTIPAGGPGGVRYLCPNLPALLGTTTWTQAVFLHGPSPTSWRLSNPAALRVLW